MSRGVRRWSAVVRKTQARLRNVYVERSLIGKSRKQNVAGKPS